MPQYEYECDTHGRFSIHRSMKEGPPRSHPCPVCKNTAFRKYVALPIHYHSQGFHQTDYDSQGDKLERLNKEYKKEYGEDPPKPASDVPRNSSNPY